MSHHAGPACLPLPAAVDVQTERAQSSEFPAPSASSVWFMGNQSVWGLRPLVFRSGSVRLTANWEGKFLLVVQRTGRFSFPLSRVYMRKFIVVLRLKAVLSHNYPSYLVVKFYSCILKHLLIKWNFKNRIEVFFV